MSQGAELSGATWALVADLFLRTKVAALVRDAGLTPRFFVNPAELVSALAATRGPETAGAPPVLLVLDLSDREGWGFRALESLPKGRPPVLAFYSHVEAETRTRALELGAERVVPRSAFVLQFARLARELIVARA